MNWKTKKHAHTFTARSMYNDSDNNTLLLHLSSTSATTRVQWLFAVTFPRPSYTFPKLKMDIIYENISKNDSIWAVAYVCLQQFISEIITQCDLCDFLAYFFKIRGTPYLPFKLFSPANEKHIYIWKVAHIFLRVSKQSAFSHFFVRIQWYIGIYVTHTTCETL